MSDMTADDVKTAGLVATLRKAHTLQSQLLCLGPPFHCGDSTAHEVAAASLLPPYDILGAWFPLHQTLGFSEAEFHMRGFCSSFIPGLLF